LKKTIITSPAFPPAAGPYSQVCAAGELLFTSGQLPVDTKTGLLAEGGLEAQTYQGLNNLQAVLEATGSGLAQVLKTTIFLTDLNNFSKVNDIYGSYFSQEPPARSTVEVSRLPKNSLLEIEAVALRKNIA
jgi:2-iminobutanoate/2-iminopropanoate deaminase